MNETQGRPTHSSLLVCYREGEASEIHFLAMHYTEVKNGNPVTFVKFPVETGIGNEAAKDTATSGMYQEIAKTPSDFGFRFAQAEPIYQLECAGDADKGGGTHTKCVFLLTGLRGELRADELVEEGKKGRGDEKLGPPTWYEAAVLLDLMKERGVRFHRTALMRALAYLAQERGVYNKYRGLLESLHNQQYLTD